MPDSHLNVGSAMKLPPGIVRKRERCPYCGRMIKPRFQAAYATQPYRHKCPHGSWCSASKRKFWCREDDRCPKCAEERAREAAEKKVPPLPEGEAAARGQTETSTLLVGQRTG